MIKEKASKINQLRIIGGAWRSRKVSFMEAEGLRPTPDRVRETLFNWLAPYVEGANTLDLFAGSGALSFEALSRGAAKATLLDVNREVVNHLRSQLQQLKCETATLINQSASLFLQQAGNQQFDIVFLDPPFSEDMLERSCALLAENDWLSQEAWIYTESDMSCSRLQLPSNWQLYKEKKAGNVYYALWRSMQR